MQRLDSNQRSRAYETRGDDRTPLPCVNWSVCEDLNLGPLRPERSALTRPKLYTVNLVDATGFEPVRAAL